MTVLRNFLMKQSDEVINLFSSILSSFWNEFNVNVWEKNKSFSVYIGKDILLFIKIQ